MILSYSKSLISKVRKKDTTLFSVRKKEFSTINVARLKLMAMFINALCKVQTVNYERLALSLFMID